MTLDRLLADIVPLRTLGDTARHIASLAFDSRETRPGSLFFALPGTAVDGHRFIPAAIAAGAAAIVCRTLPERLDPQVAYLIVEDPHEALGRMASTFYGHPSRELRLVGITGTNGKTTTATLLADLFARLGYLTGLISTVTYRIGDEEYPSSHTTPDPLRLNALLRRMADAGCAYCFMEASSHSIVQRRIAGLDFAGGLFTNLTHDHLDYHKTFAEYLRAKQTFFDGLPRGAFALYNGDDRNGAVMVQNTRARRKSFALRSAADYRGRIVEQHLDGMLLELDGTQLWTALPGRFNAYNVLGVYAAALELGADRNEVLTALSALHSVRGRFEPVRSATGITAIVDYAHTPDALRNVIDTIRETLRSPARLLVVAGCGGDRDRTKRPEMARIAAEGGDLAILTSDNPRTEDPAAILAEMRTGLAPGRHALTIVDRAEAIRAAVAAAMPGDIVLVAGKGHETYQIIGTEKHHFDDREQVRQAFEELGK